MDFAREMLVEAFRAWMNCGADVEPEMAGAYLAGWGRQGDRGVLATNDDGEPIGAAWMRTFSLEAPGLAFVAPSVPEIVFAVEESERYAGLGTRLVEGLVLLAKADKCSFVSLATPREGPARTIATKHEFADAGLSDEDDPLVILLACL